jgi:LysM domain
MATRSQPARRNPATTRLGRLVSLAWLAAVAVAVVLLGACLPAGTRGGPLVESAGPSGGAGAATSSVAPVPTGPTPSPSFGRPTPTPMPTFLVYTVARGDSLNTIAHRFGTTARSIAFWNRATHPSLDPESAGYRPNLLEVGWTLVLIPNVTFDEQTLPEPSDLVGPSPSDSGGDGMESPESS